MQRSLLPNIKILKRKDRKIIFMFRLDDNCWVKNYKGGIGKIYGISTNLFPFKDKNGWHPGHHRNSIRLGYVPTPEVGIISLYSYYYSIDDRIEERLGNIETGKWYIGMFVMETEEESSLCKSKIFVRKSDLDPEAHFDPCMDDDLFSNWCMLNAPDDYWYELDFYYGGASSGVAPHFMSMDIKKTYTT